MIETIRAKSKVALIATVGAALVLGCNAETNGAFSFLESSINTGTGTASVTISGYLPATANVTVKTNQTQTFSLTASGTGVLSYLWTVNGVTVQSGTQASYTFNGASYSPSDVVLVATVTDARGSTSRTWSVKVNGSPVVSAPSPEQTTYSMSVGTSQVFTATVTDPNPSETLSYEWFLDGASTGNTTNSYTFSPTTIQAGDHTLVLRVLDGAITDSGTWNIPTTWTVKANFFYSGCNAMDNEAFLADPTGHPTGYNRTCVVGGNADIGSDSQPFNSESTRGRILPAAVALTSSGNAFIADEGNDVVWYINRTTSDETILGVFVPAGQMRVVAGNGQAGTWVDGRFATQTFLNNPRGLAWDGTNLLISDFSADRVRRVGPTGPSSAYIGSTVVSTTCSQPSGLVYIPSGTGQGYYVACLNSHRIKKLAVSTFAVTDYGGDGTTGAPSDGSVPASARFHGPRDLAHDQSGNLYVSEWTGCRIRVINNQASPISFYSTTAVPGNSTQVTVAAGVVRTILGNPVTTSCTTVESNNVLMGTTSPARINNPFGLVVDAAVGAGNRVFGGIYVVNYSGGHRVNYLNLNETSTSIGGTTINPASMQRLIGSGTGGYIEGGNAVSARLNNPFDIALDPSDSSIWIADYSNYRVRKVSRTTNVISLVTGSGVFARAGTAGNNQEYTTADLFNAPRFSVYDSVNKKLFVSDAGNQRIRSISSAGLNTNEVGIGTTGAPASEDELPANVQMSTPSQMLLFGATSTFGGHLIYADTLNHCVRMWNRSLTTFSGFGLTIPAGRVRTIGGTCGSPGTATTGDAVSVLAFNSPTGVTSDGTDIYVSDTANHVLKKIDSSGNLSLLAGATGSANNTNGPLGTNRLNNPAGISYMHYINPSNASQFTKGILIADRSSNHIRLYKIAGNGPFVGQSTPTGDLERVGCGGTDHDEGVGAAFAACSAPYSVTAIDSRYFCYSNSGYNNVRCVDAQLTIAETVMGAPQGTGTTLLQFPRTPFGLTDQNNVRARVDTNYVVQTYGVEWSPQPPLSPSAPYEPWGTLHTPWGVTPGETGTLYVVENAGGNLVRKIRLAAP
jgi:hypothetical protein